MDGSKVKWADEGEKFRATLCSQVNHLPTRQQRQLHRITPPLPLCCAVAHMLQVTISMAILCVIGAVVSIFWFKIFAIANPQYFSLLGFSFGPILVSLANSVQIQVGRCMPSIERLHDANSNHLLT